MLRISNKNKIIIYIVSYIISCVLLLTDSMLTKGKFNETFALNFKFDFSFWGLAFLVSIPILISIILILIRRALSMLQPLLLLNLTL